MATTKFGMTLPLMTDAPFTTIPGLASALQALDDLAMSGEQAFNMCEVNKPGTPLNGRACLYFKNDDKLYKLTSLGVEVPVGSEYANVFGPATNRDQYIPHWNGVNLKTLAEGDPLTKLYSTCFPVHAAPIADINILNGMAEAFTPPDGVPTPLADNTYTLNVADGGYLIIK
jgi:hypothetical protein